MVPKTPKPLTAAVRQAATVGHYYRPDIFRLEVDERKKPAIHQANFSKKGDQS